MKEKENGKIKRRGVTLIEVLFVLGIASVLLGMVMLFLSSATQKRKTQELLTEINLLIDASNTLTSSSNKYTTLSPDVLVKSGLIPTRFISNGQLVTPFGGSIDVIPFNYTEGGEDFYLAFNFNGLPRESCEWIGVQDFGGSAQSVTVTNMRQDAPDGFSPIQVISNCQNGDNNYVNVRIQH